MGHDMGHIVQSILIATLCAAAAVILFRQRSRLGFGSRGFIWIVFGLLVISFINYYHAVTDYFTLSSDSASHPVNSLIGLLDIFGLICAVFGLARWLPTLVRAGGTLERDIVISRIAEKIARVSGQDFFQALTNAIAEELKADLVLVGVLTQDHKSIQTIAASKDQAPSTNFRYPLEGSPCQTVFDGEVSIFEDDVAALFPEDTALKDLGLKSYGGCTLINSKGDPIGILVVAKTVPTKDTALLEAIITVFADRAAVEIDRQEALHHIHKRSIELEEAQHIGRIGHWASTKSPDSWMCSNIIYQILEIPAQDFLEMNTFITLIHAQDRANFLLFRYAAMSRDKELDMDLRIVTPKGNEKWISIIGRPNKDLPLDDFGFSALPAHFFPASDTDCMGFYHGTLQDITERKQAETSLLEAHAAKTQFVAIMSHELRTPLNPILGFSSLIAKDVDDQYSRDQIRSYAEQINESAHQMHRLVEDILDFSGVELNRLNFEWDETDLTSLMKDVVQHMSHQAQSSGLQLQSQFPDRPVLAIVDRKRIRQILVNLISNAIKFTDSDGHIEIGLIHDDHEIEIWVKDTGCGMTEDEISQYLHPFRQGGNILNRNEGGLGLGLAISKALVEGHGGRLTIESSHQEGTRIRVALPRHHDI